MIVDIHAHHVSNELLAAVRKQPGRYGVRLQPIDGGGERLVFDDGRATRPVFATLREMDLRLGQMDESGVEVQCICTWMDLVGYWVPMPAGGRWARLQNDTLAQTAAEQASRLKPVATVPLQDPAAAVTELEYCAKELGMRVVEVGTNINGRNLDDPAFDPFWATAQELDMLVFLHPLDQAGAERMQRYWLFNTVGNLTETTLAATSLIYGAVLDRFPHLRVCLAHAGGFLPYQIGRYDRGYEMHEVCRGCAMTPHSLLSTAHCPLPTAHCPLPTAHCLPALVVQADRDQIAPRPLHQGVGVRELPEADRMIGLDEVRQLVDEDGVADPVWHLGQAVRDPDHAPRRGAASEAAVLIAHIANVRKAKPPAEITPV